MSDADRLRKITAEVSTKLLAEKKIKDEANRKKLVEDIYRFALERAESAARKGLSVVPDIYIFSTTDQDGRDKSECVMTSNAILEKLRSEGFTGEVVILPEQGQWHWRVEMRW